MWARLKRWLDGPETGDGFGQSFAEDIAFAHRFRRCRRYPAAWRRPSADESAWVEAHPIVARFGDDTLAVADVDGRRWIVRERIWCGWPDPPQYAFFALDGDAIWAARDFDTWPSVWIKPWKETAPPPP